MKQINPLEQIQKTYETNGDLLFRIALAEVVQHGQDVYTKANLECTLSSITKRHASYTKDSKSFPVMTEEFEKAIVNCAYEIAQCETWDILRYIYLRKIYIGG